MIKQDYGKISDDNCIYSKDNMIKNFNINSKESDFNTKHYIFWSGGNDSTLLLYELLNRFPQENIIAISYQFPWLTEHKMESENNFREKFKNLMYTKGFTKWRHTTFRTDITNSKLTGVDSVIPKALYQPIAWLLAAPILIESNSIVYLGTNKNDDLTLYMNDLENLFKLIANIMKKNMILSQPYQYLSKTDIIKKILEYDLYDYTWHCELPVKMNIPCYKCKPCKDYISAIIDITCDKSDKDIQTKAKNILKELIKNKEMKDKDNEDNNIIETIEDI